MPPVLALVLTLGFIGFLFCRDFRQRPNVTGAIWIPILWMFIIASRPFSTWLSILGLPVHGAVTVEEGSTVDSIAYFLLIAAGTYVLARRQVGISQFMRDNLWLTIFLFYCLLAVLWSDFPVISLKRWIKILGHPIMVCVLLTEPEPQEAFVSAMKRCAYVLLPVSILWMKYYPTLGRRGSEWGGMTNIGITGGKNELGGVCLIWGLFLLWQLLNLFRRRNAMFRGEWQLTMMLLLMVGYCLWKTHSATAVLSLGLSGITMVLLGLRTVNKRAIGTYIWAAIILLCIAQLTFGIYGKIVDLSGHESTIEGRGRLWNVLLQTDSNALLGAGFESYWLGERVEKIWAMPEFWWHPNQAHNGYLELYLNLGLGGLCLFLGVIVSTYRNIRIAMLETFEWGIFRMSCLFAILAYNWTEAGLKGLGLTFWFLFLISINYKRSEPNWFLEEQGTDKGEANKLASV
jgi:exopolysaccharide production protein ExoQ